MDFEPLWAIKVVLNRFGLIWAWSLVSQPGPQNSGGNPVCSNVTSILVGIFCASCSANLASKIDQCSVGSYLGLLMSKFSLGCLILVGTDSL